MEKEEHLIKHRESQSKYRRSEKGRIICYKYNNEWKKRNRDKINKYFRQWIKQKIEGNPNYFKEHYRKYILKLQKWEVKS